VQTATLFTVATGFSGPLRAHPRLLPDAQVAGLVAWAESGLSGPSVWFGHNPNIGVVAAHLLGLSRLPWPISPGTVIGLKRAPEGPCRLSFFASPGAPVRETLSG
jgi:phosphohistidine phosphatase SixA